MEKQSQHYVQNRIIKNWKYTINPNNIRVHYYSLLTKSIESVKTKNLFEEDLFYDHIKQGLEDELNDKVERPFIEEIVKLDFSKSSIEINRNQLIIIKRYLALQFVRTKSFFENNLKFDKAKMRRMIEEILNVQLNNDFSEQSIFGMLFKQNYLAFWKTPKQVEYVLPDKGIIKEPASLLTYWIFPICPTMAIALLPIQFKLVLEGTNFPIRKPNAGLTYARDLLTSGYFDVIKDNDIIKSMCCSNIPLLFYTPNIAKYKISPGFIHSDDIFLYQIFELDIPTASYVSFTIMDEATTGFAFHDVSKLAYPLYFYKKMKRQAPLIDFSVLWNEIKQSSPESINEIEMMEKAALEWKKRITNHIRHPYHIVKWLND